MYFTTQLPTQGDLFLLTSSAGLAIICTLFTYYMQRYLLANPDVYLSWGKVYKKAITDLFNEMKDYSLNYIYPVEWQYNCYNLGRVILQGNEDIWTIFNSHPPIATNPECAALTEELMDLQHDYRWLLDLMDAF